MSMKYLILPLLLLSLSCNQKKTNVLVSKENIEGYWILSNYIDKIMENKSIYPQVKQKLTWNVILLKIDNDSIETHGLIMKNKLSLSNNLDSLTTINGMNHNYELKYLSASKIITAINLEEKDTINYIFRKLKPDERRLINGIDNKYFHQGLSSNFYSFFIDNIISGSYKYVKDSTKSVDFYKNGTTKGFKGYNQFSIHDYFGTLHPFPSDAIIFRDTTKVRDFKKPPLHTGIYNWKFRKDTLILTEMKTKNYEEYFIGTEVYELIKNK